MRFFRDFVGGFLGSTVGIYALAGATNALADVTTVPPYLFDGGLVYVATALDGLGDQKSEGVYVDNTGTQYVNVEASGNAGNFESGTASASLSVNLLPSPVLSASAHTNSVDAYVDAYAVVTILYDVEILGPAGSVDLGVKAASTASSSGSGGAGTELELLGLQPITGVGSTDYTFETDSGGGVAVPGFAESFNVNTSYTTQADAQFAVLMSVGAESYNFASGPGSATAYLDPIFTVPAGYSLEFSPGVGNVGGVPEPSTWAMMLIGFAGLSFAGFRKTRDVAKMAKA